MTLLKAALNTGDGVSDLMLSISSSVAGLTSATLKIVLREASKLKTIRLCCVHRTPTGRVVFDFSLGVRHGKKRGGRGGKDRRQACEYPAKEPPIKTPDANQVMSTEV
jgi:hypothetical protein